MRLPDGGHVDLREGLAQALQSGVGVARDALRVEHEDVAIVLIVVYTEELTKGECSGT